MMAALRPLLQEEIERQSASIYNAVARLLLLRLVFGKLAIKVVTRECQGFLILQCLQNMHSS